MGVKSSFEKVARFFSKVSQATSLDVVANRKHLRSGDSERIRDGLRFLAELGPTARDARSDVALLLEHGDPAIAQLAVQAMAAIERS